METSSKSLVRKMEELLEKAKREPSEEKVRGYIIAIQAFCEVILDDKPSNPATSLQVSNVGNQVVTTVQSRASMPISEPIKIDDANGNSIFDF